MSDNKTKETRKSTAIKTQKVEEDLTGLWLVLTFIVGTMGLGFTGGFICEGGLWLSYLMSYITISSVMWFLVSLLTKKEEFKIWRTVALSIIVGIAAFVMAAKVVTAHDFLIMR